MSLEPPHITNHTEDRGASAVEYGLLIAGVAALIVVAVLAFGGSVENLFSDTCHTVSNSADPANAGSCK